MEEISQHKKILALDVEGTIITGYDYNAEPDHNGKFPAIIDSDLKNILEKFHNAGFTIVLATGTDSDNLTYYESEFTRYGFNEYIKSIVLSSMMRKTQSSINYANTQNTSRSTMRMFIFLMMQ